MLFRSPRTWRAWIPRWFARGLRYTLLAAGWAGTRSLIVVPPAAPSGALERVLAPLQARIVRRAENILQRLPPGSVQWRLMTAEPPRRGSVAPLAGARRHLRVDGARGKEPRGKPSYPGRNTDSSDARTSA